MKTCQFVVFCLSVCSLATAQNGLRDIPSTKVEDQKAGFKLPEGASINLFAAEPLLKKPVHMNWDSEGRLWVVSSPLYPHIEPGQEEIDQVIILEDTNGDGAADKSTVFADHLHIPTAVLPGDGGAYVANSTEVLFLEDTDNDGKADRREIVLSGFGTEDTHHLLHTFRWGPEGMIWMNQSIYIHTHLETPYGIRRLLGGGMWSFRPETQRAEVFMKGLINPWGHVFDRYGQSFLTDGAGHEGINFVFPGSVFRTSPGASRVLPGLNPGQPKHCGAEILSGPNIPEKWQGAVAAPDFRGHRINLFKLTENGTAAYDSTQIEDLVACTHRAFRPIDVKMGPDGAIYIADWYNPIIQHGEVDFRDERRDHEHGRIWRISFPDRPAGKKVEFAKLSDAKLALLAGPVGWNEQMATVELRKRNPDTAIEGIREAFHQTRKDEDRLHLVMASQAVNRFQDDWAAELAMTGETPQVRAAALRALYYQAGENLQARNAAVKAIGDSHPRVRLWGVCILSQLPDSDTVQLALDSLEGIENPDDFHDFAVWKICRDHSHKWLPIAQDRNPFRSASQLLYAMRAVNTNVGSDSVLDSFAKGEFSTPKSIEALADWIARSGGERGLNLVFDKARSQDTPDDQKAILLNALVNAGKIRKVTPSAHLDRITVLLESENAGIHRAAAALAGQWKISSARSFLEKDFVGRDRTRSDAALEGLRAFGGAETGKFLRNLAEDKGEPESLRARAITGMARFNPAAAARLAATTLPNFKDPQVAGNVFSAFLANNQATTHLTNALNGGTTLPEDIALAGLQKASGAATKPTDLIAAIQKSGNLRPMKTSLTPEELNGMMQEVAEKGDPHRGEAVYRKAALQCVLCHAIGGHGGIIGPDLVSIGASAPVDYLIESLLEPSKKIKEGYHTTLVTMKNGDTFAGALAREDTKELVIRDSAGTEHRLAKNEIKSKNVSPVSLMPPGLTMSLRKDEFVDLVRFLSELGKEGDFKTTPIPYIRKWEALLPHERTRDAIGHYGKTIFAEDFKSYIWTPFVATVDGRLPISETPDVRGRGKNRYGVVRHSIEVKKPGPLKLRIEGKTNDLNLFLDETEVPLPENQMDCEVSIDVKPGQHRLTFSGLKGWGLDYLRVEILK